MKRIVLVTAVWCPSCLIMRPRYQQFVKNHTSWTIEEIDFDEAPQVVKSLKIGKTLPVAVIFVGEVERLRFVGEYATKKIEEIMADL